MSDTPLKALIQELMGEINGVLNFNRHLMDKLL